MDGAERGEGMSDINDPGGNGTEPELADAADFDGDGDGALAVDEAGDTPRKERKPPKPRKEKKKGMS